jgi:putative ABC transport system permease protein
MDSEWISILRYRFRALIHRRRLDRDLEGEIAFHLATRAEKLGSAAARRNFGNPTIVKETMRDMWTINWLDMLGKDLRYAGRTLRKSPGFAAVAILTLALGIGANTAIFSVVNAVLLHPLPYPEAERLVELWGNVKRARVERRGTSFADYLDWKRQSKSFDAMALFTNATHTLNGLGEPERIPTEFVGYGYFEMLGMRPQIGRSFQESEDQVPQRDRVVVLSDGLWKRRFGGDPGVLGRAVQLNDGIYSIVGVMPPAFRGVDDSADLWLPLMMAVSQQDLGNRGSRGPAVLARLKSGVAREQAQSEMDAISKRLEQQYPVTNEARGVEISPLEQEIFGSMRNPLVALLVAVGLVLLIACANVANLLLARSESRQREIAVRMALGAGRGRMLHQLTAESLVLALTGAAAGLLCAHWGVRALVAASPVTFPGYVNPGIDWTVALFTAAISCAAGLVMGLAPAVQVRASNLFEAFKHASSHAAGSRGGHRFRSALVVAEIAFAMLLLVGAGLLIRSIQQLAAIHPGYDPTGVLTLRIGMPRLAAGSTAQAAVTAREIVRKVSAIPGVETVAAASDIPLGGASAIFYTAEGQAPVTAQNMPRAYVHRAGANFFETLRIRFVAGRTFTEEETKGATVAIVTENLVRRFWPGQDPIGKRIKGGRADSNEPWMTIVGVVNEMKYRGLPENPTADPDLFLPFQDQARQFSLLLRTPVDPASLTGGVRRTLRETDSTAVIYSVSTLNELMSRQTANARFTGWLMTIFAASALLLAMIGIYGVMSYSVARRRQEIGIRVALGAARTDVLRMVVGGGMTLIGVGLTLGAVGALAMTRLLSALLYGVTPRDALTFAAAALVLAGVAILACLIPATRAAKIHPAIALRTE